MKVEFIAFATSEILAQILQDKELPLGELINRYHQGMIRDRLTIFTLGCGVACHWEVTVRLLAQQLGVDIYKPSSSGKAKSPEIFEIEPVVEELKEKVPALDLKLGRLAKLRNAMIHGNFHQIRIVWRNRSPSKSERQRASQRHISGGGTLCLLV